MRRFALTLLAMMLTAGCSAPRPDPLAARQHSQQAEQLILARDYAGASVALAAAVAAAPNDLQLRLRQAEILEATDRPKEAADVYQRIRRELATTATQQQEIDYLLGTLAALRLGDPQQARQLMTQLPAGTARRIDLEGLLTLQQGESRQALILFNDALQRQPDPGTAARILYHAARAYRALGDDNHAVASLYRAVNLAEDLGVTREIELLFHEIKHSEPR